ncbi:ATP-dependent Clp protease ATP-binding subunit ClpX [uncultured Bifidobacterium sp.]|uniref:ATP-dependent Clp protease ATP-binding subunit ClpX n=1 Tax=uncultured Bifidobacterium sp. TaxID=165187 RepID=UPI00260A1D94|nr:ATP-dependent Clp protease ATP-binding subunit ClpX [uncultured Bifidobacterium sp.]
MGEVVSYNEDSPRCTFCGKSEHQVRKLVTGPSAAICDECIGLCVEIISEEARRDAVDNAVPLPSPAAVKKHLDRYVVGQDAAKRTLAVAVRNHYKRVNMDMMDAASTLRVHTRGDDKDVHAPNEGGPLQSVKVEKSNILMIGPTGVGKTYLAKTLASAMDVPFAMTDATTLTEAGYVGDDVETVLQRLVQAADGDVEMAQHGIIYIDEIDKIARKSGENTSITRDVSGEGVQQALLKIIEGTTASVPVEGTRKHREQETVKIDTSGILFICGGAFVGLADIIERRLGAHTSGFASTWRSEPIDEHDILSHATADDLADFGLLPEFIGRLPIVTVLHDLDEDDLVRILTEPVDALTKQYERLVAMDGAELSFTPEALRAIAHSAVDSGTGARGLRAIIEHVLEGTMFDLPQRDDVAKVIVEEECVTQGAAPTVILASERQQRGRLLA